MGQGGRLGRLGRLGRFGRTTAAVCAVAIAVQGAPAHAATLSSHRSGGSKTVMCANVRAGGHNYEVNAFKVSCLFADKWAGALAGRRLKSGAENVKLSGGPSGYACRADAAGPSNGPGGQWLKPGDQEEGNCVKSQSPAGAEAQPSYLAWEIVQPL